MTSFKGAGVVVRVGKRPGMEGVSLLHDEEREQGQKEKEKEEKEAGPEKGDNLWESISNRVVRYWHHSWSVGHKKYMHVTGHHMDL